MTVAADELLLSAAEVEIQATGKSPAVSIVAYTGGLMVVPGWGPVAIELGGIDASAEQVSILADHNASLAGIVGHGKALVVNGKLLVQGAITPSTDAARQVVDLAKGGFRFQASVGVAPLEYERLRAGGRWPTMAGFPLTLGFVAMRVLRLRSFVLAAALVGLLVPLARGQQSPRFTGPWNVENLKKAPPASWGQVQGLVQEVYYEGEPLAGKPTRVFAYFARPKQGAGKVPGMVLVHGGGGTAFAEWAALWAERGYAAIAMDLAGCGPDKKRLADGGPPQDDHAKFRDFTDAEADQMWTYHAVAAVLRGHSLLAAQEGVDAGRIGVTGISWGGYLTCIVAGIDDRLRVAVPVYGCGFLHENSCWLPRLNGMQPEQRDRWVKFFDPSRYLPGVRCPILFMNGTNDFAYPLDSYRKCYRLVPGPVDLRIEVQMPHGHPQGWAPKEIGLYVDSVLRGGDPLPKLGPLKTAGSKASAACTAKVPLTKGEIHFTHDAGAWQQRKWLSAPAALTAEGVEADLPQQRPIVYYLSVTDQRGAMMSTAHEELP